MIVTTQSEVLSKSGPRTAGGRLVARFADPPWVHHSDDALVCRSCGMPHRAPAEGVPVGTHCESCGRDLRRTRADALTLLALVVAIVLALGGVVALTASLFG